MQKNYSGRNIRKFRESKNMSLQTLSNCLLQYDIHLTPADLDKIESGDRVVRDFELLGFMFVFRRPFEDFSQE